MMQPLNLMTQAAGLDLEEMLSAALNAPSAQNVVSFVANTMPTALSVAARGATSQDGLGDALRSLAASPSPVPRGEFTSPDPFMAQGTLTPDGNGGSVFNAPQPQAPQDPIEASLQGLTTSGVQPLTPSASNISRFGLQTEDPFGTPDPERAREILRMLMAGG